MKKTVAIILVLCLCLAGCGKLPETDHFAENSLTLLPEVPEKLPVTYVIYDGNDESKYQVRTDGEFTVTGFKREPAEEAGYDRIVLDFTLSVELTYDKETDTELSYCAFAMGAFDKYTGKALPERDLTGGKTYAFREELKIGGKTYGVDYTSLGAWNWGDWEYDDGGNGIQKGTCSGNYIFQIPSDYDGLVLGLVAQTEVGDAAPQAGDTAKDVAERLPGTVFFAMTNGEENKE